MGILGVICGMIIAAYLIVILGLGGCAVVIEVLVSPSSAVTEVCEGFLLGLTGNLLHHSPRLSPKSVWLFGWRIKKR